MGLSVPDRKHIMSPLRPQQVISIDVWRLYINITTTILCIIYHPVFYLKHSLQKTGFCLCLQVEPTQLRQSRLAQSIDSNWAEDGQRILSPKGWVLTKSQDVG
jgi:hypothetical protein